MRAAAHRQWVLGYVSGFNVAGPDQTGNLMETASRDELYAATDGYCARHPTSVIADAMRPIAEAIIGRRGTPAIATEATERKKSATVEAATTCQQWASGKNNSILRIAYVLALGGYITAYNQWGPDPLGDAIGAEDPSLIGGAADKWCSEHPSGLLIGVVQPLIDHVAAERVAGRLPPGGKRPPDEFSGVAAVKR